MKIILLLLLFHLLVSFDMLTHWDTVVAINGAVFVGSLFSGSS